jgi:hypothetical protein
MALVVYCVVLLIIPLTYLHVEDLLLDNSILMDLAHQETDLLVLIHEALFVHLRNLTDHLYRPVDRICDQLIDQTNERVFPDVMALKPCLLSLALLASAICTLRRYSFRKGRTLPQTIFCYRLFEHSPPLLYSL